MPAITCDKVDFRSITDINGTISVDDHAFLKVEGICTAESARQLETMPAKETVSYTAGSTGMKIFTGFISELDIDHRTDVAHVSITLKSHDVHTDLLPHIRTFQDKDKTYRQVFSAIEGDSRDISFKLPEIADKPVNCFLVQYHETDWQFAQRVASLKQTVVVPDYIMGKPIVTIGMPKKSTKASINVIDYWIKKDVEKYLDYSSNNVKLTENDVIGYIVKSRDAIELCDPVSFDNRTLYVYAIQISHDDEELMYYYTLMPKSSFVTKYRPNYNLIGASLLGKIMDAQQDQVFMEVENDIVQPKYRSFTYATPYSTPDGPGFFFQPARGDTSRLCFPSEDENEAYVASSVHVSHGSRTNPKIRFFRTPEGQELYFDPSTLRIDDGTGSTITISGNKMRLETNKNIQIYAKKDINITAGGKVNMIASESIGLKQGRGFINITDKSLTIASVRTKIE